MTEEMTAQTEAKDPSVPRLVKLRKDAQCCSCGKAIPRGQKAWKSSTPPWHWLNESGMWFTFTEHEICADLARIIGDMEDGVAGEPEAFRDQVLDYFVDIDTEAIIAWSDRNPDRNFGEIGERKWVEFLRGEPSDLDRYCGLRDVGEINMATLHAWLDFVFPKEVTA